VDISLYIGTVN